MPAGYFIISLYSFLVITECAMRENQNEMIDWGSFNITKPRMLVFKRLISLSGPSETLIKTVKPACFHGHRD